MKTLRLIYTLGLVIFIFPSFNAYLILKGLEYKHSKPKNFNLHQPRQENW